MPPSPLLEATFGAMAAKTVYAAAELRLADLHDLRVIEAAPA